MSEKYRLGFLKAARWGMDGQACWRIRQYEINWLETGGLIYHYTSIRGLLGIVNSNGIWASHVAFMNDAQEVIHGRMIAKRIFLEYAKRRASCEFSNILKRAAELIDKNGYPDLYVACFSRDGDSLDLWRGYYQDGTTVAVEFDLERSNPFSVMPVMSLHQVTYGPEAQMRRILLKVKRYEHEFLNDLEFYKNKPLSKRIVNNHLEETAQHLVSNVEFLLPSFKNPAFKSEKEVRLIIHGDHEKHFAARHFRSTPHFLIPYFPTSELLGKDKDGKTWSETHRLPISRIIVGPSPYSKLAIKSIRDFFAARGEEVDVVPSRVPFQSFR
jgi:hypothetical protein